jgi:hypothetical protein
MWEFGRRYSGQRPWGREDGATAAVATREVEVGIPAAEVEDIRVAGASSRRASSLTKIEGRLRRMTLRS